MAKERLSMRKLKEVLRLKFESDLSNRQIAKSRSTSHVTVGKYLALAEQAALSWPLPENLDDAEIEKRLVEHVPRKPSQKPAMPLAAVPAPGTETKACHSAAALV